MKNLENLANSLDDIQDTLKKNQKEWEQKWPNMHWGASDDTSTKRMLLKVNASNRAAGSPENGSESHSQPLKARYEALGEALKDLRHANLNRYSTVMQNGEKSVRVFLPQESSQGPLKTQPAASSDLETSQGNTPSPAVTAPVRKRKRRVVRRQDISKMSENSDLNTKNTSVQTIKKTANVVGDVGDLFARGLDTARAVTEMFMHAEQKEAYSKLINLLASFTTMMRTHNKTYQTNTLTGIKDGIAELALFNGALATLVKESLHIEEKSQAINAINFVRDVIWKRDMSIASCTIESFAGQELGKSTTVIRYTEPMTFNQKATVDSRDDSTPTTTSPSPTDSLLPVHQPLPSQAINLWDDVNKKPWYQKLLKSVGIKTATKKRKEKNALPNSAEKMTSTWMERFINDNLDSLKSNASTPMSRFTPNPSNAFICYDVLIQDGQVVHSNQNTRIAITAPIAVGNTKSLQPITNFNHAQMLTPEHLSISANTLFQNWEGFVEPQNHKLKMPILFQTLIGDEATFSPDQKKVKASRWNGSFIDYKAAANNKLREDLKERTILRNRATGNIIFVKKNEIKQEDFIAQGYDEVELDLLETNACINMWDFRARQRNNDYDHSRRLIQHFSTFLKDGNKKIDSPDLEEIIKFLDGKHYSFFLDYKAPSKSVKTALTQLEAALKQEGNTAFSGLAVSVKNNLLLTARAAVELKCLTHETYLGALRRRITNFTRDHFRKLPIVGHLLDWAVRLPMTVLATVFKTIAAVLTFPVSIPRGIKHLFDRKPIYKALYEGIVADALGMRVGGCMSSADRGPEMAEQQATLKKAFIAEGVFLSYHSSMREKIGVLIKYGTSCAKHFFLMLATGTVGSADTEMRGVFNARGVISALQSKVEQKIAKMFSSFRKGKYKTTTVEAYAARGTAPLADKQGLKAKPFLTKVEDSSDDSFDSQSEKPSIQHARRASTTRFFAQTGQNMNTKEKSKPGQGAAEEAFTVQVHLPQK